MKIFKFFTVPAKYCTDNAAMIAFLGFEKYVSSNFYYLFNCKT